MKVWIHALNALCLKTALLLLWTDRLLPLYRSPFNIYVHIGNLMYSIDFVVLDRVPTQRPIPFLLERPFLAMSEAKVDCRSDDMIISCGDKKNFYNIFERRRKREVGVVDRGKDKEKAISRVSKT